VIRIRKLPASEMPWFPRRWVASSEPDDDGIADHILGYFYTQQDAIDHLQYPARIVDITGAIR